MSALARSAPTHCVGSRLTTCVLVSYYEDRNPKYRQPAALIAAIRAIACRCRRSHHDN